MLELVIYRDAAGQEPFQAWFDHLDAHSAAKVTAVLKRMAAGSLAEIKSVGSGVSERRIDWGQGTVCTLGGMVTG